MVSMTGVLVWLFRECGDYVDERLIRMCIVAE